MSQFLFESKHGKVWRNPVTGGHSCESRDVNALAGELAEALAAERAELEAVNALGRQWGFGQGELDDDLAGCLSHKLEAERAAREAAEAELATERKQRIIDREICIAHAREMDGAIEDLKAQLNTTDCEASCYEVEQIVALVREIGVGSGSTLERLVAIREKLATVTAERDALLAAVACDANQRWHLKAAKLESSLAAAQQRLERLTTSLRSICEYVHSMPPGTWTVEACTCKNIAEDALTESEAKDV